MSYIHVYIKQYKDQKSSFEVTEMKRFLIGALNLNLHRRRRHTKAWNSVTEFFAVRWDGYSCCLQQLKWFECRGLGAQYYQYNTTTTLSLAAEDDKWCKSSDRKFTLPTIYERRNNVWVIKIKTYITSNMLLQYWYGYNCHKIGWK